MLVITMLFEYIMIDGLWAVECCLKRKTIQAYISDSAKIGKYLCIFTQTIVRTRFYKMK
jgi:hypothetical protein